MSFAHRHPRKVAWGAVGAVLGLVTAILNLVPPAVIQRATPVVAHWEGGRRPDGSATAYADQLARGLPTACEGVTGQDHLGRPIVVGRRYSREECDAMLAHSLRIHGNGIWRCLHPPRPLPINTGAAVVSLGFNIGESNFCRSTVARRINAGDFRQACAAFMMWNRSAATAAERRRGLRGAQVRRGLSNRRTAERTLCLSGLE